MTDANESSFLSRMRPLQEERVRAARARRSTAALEALTGKRPAPKDFAGALRRQDGGQVRLIAEVKKASPSAGSIRDGDPLFFARAMAGGGAAAISVLTEERFFQGHSTYLEAIHDAVDLPLLRKDFLFDSYQVAEARAWGADAVLLIVAMLDDATLGELLGAARQEGLDVLVEAHSADEIDRAVAAGATLIGVNNRDLHTFVTSLETAERLRPRIPAGVGTVAESGIETAAHVARMVAAGYDAVLVGEALMRAPDPGAALEALLA